MNGTLVAKSSCPVGTLFDSSSSRYVNANLATCRGNTRAALSLVNDRVLRTGYVPHSAFVCDPSNPADTTCKLAYKKKNKFFRYATAPPAAAVD